MNNKMLKTVLFAALFQGTFGVRPSPGCSITRNRRSDDKSFIETVYVTYEDKLLGPVDRNYIIQVPDSGKIVALWTTH